MPKLTDTWRPVHVESKTANNETITESAFDAVHFGYLCYLLRIESTDVTVDAKLQESDDATTWSDITGAAITQVGSGETATACIELDRTASGRKRYVRIVITVGNATGADISVWRLAASLLSASSVIYADIDDRVTA
jgi:hypothetical protein